jgi:sugar-specific transcriptional regulator TrmB
MGMQTQKIIESLGYTKNEARVYMAALALGECHVSDIAQKVRLPRSTTQTIIDGLHKHGLMNFYVRKRYKYWVAERPVHLLEALKKREDDVRAIIPKLDALRRDEDEKPHVRILEGTDEIRHIYEDMLETKQRIMCLIPWDAWVALMGRGFMEDFIDSRVRHFLSVRMLSPRTPLTEQLRARDTKEMRSLRFIPEDIAVNTTIFIYGGKVVIVSLNKKLPTAVVIEDPDIAHTQTLFFEELWGRSGE